MKRTTELSRWGAAALVIIALVVLGAVAITVANRPSTNSSGGAELPDPSDPRLSLTVDAERQHRAAQITSTFENSTLELPATGAKGPRQVDRLSRIGLGCVISDRAERSHVDEQRLHQAVAVLGRP